MPDSLAHVPQVHPWLLVFERAFHDLVGDRAAPGLPITWMARQRWAEVQGLDDLATDLLHRHVTAMDVAYMKWQRDHAPKGKKQPMGDATPEVAAAE